MFKRTDLDATQLRRLAQYHDHIEITDKEALDIADMMNELKELRDERASAGVQAGGRETGEGATPC